VLSAKNLTKPVKTAIITKHESAGTHPAAFSHNQDPKRTCDAETKECARATRCRDLQTSDRVGSRRLDWRQSKVATRLEADMPTGACGHLWLAWQTAEMNHIVLRGSASRISWRCPPILPVHVEAGLQIRTPAVDQVDSRGRTEPQCKTFDRRRRTSAHSPRST